MWDANTQINTQTTLQSHSIHIIFLVSIQMNVVSKPGNPARFGHCLQLDPSGLSRSQKLH